MKERAENEKYVLIVIYITRNLIYLRLETKLNKELICKEILFKFELVLAF